MSRLWPDRVLAVLYPDKVEFFHLRAGWRSEQSAGIVPCHPLPAQPVWKPCVDALKQRFHQLPTKSRLTVILSNQFVHYVMVPWSEALIKKDEQQTWARICFEKKYGDMARKWDLRIDSAGFGKPYIASGIDQAFLKAIQEVCKDSGSVLVSLQPLLMYALNQMRNELKGQGRLIFIVEPRHAAILKTDRSGIVELKSAVFAQDLDQELEMLHAREVLLNGAMAEKPYLVMHENLKIHSRITSKFEIKKYLSCSYSRNLFDKLAIAKA